MKRPELRKENVFTLGFGAAMVWYLGVMAQSLLIRAVPWVRLASCLLLFTVTHVGGVMVFFRFVRGIRQHYAVRVRHYVMMVVVVGLVILLAAFALGADFIVAHAWKLSVLGAISAVAGLIVMELGVYCCKYIKDTD